ncbi:MAG: hypothetical protein ACKOEC_19150 [Acidimicrobiia bacterium]
MIAARRLLMLTALAAAGCNGGVETPTSATDTASTTATILFAGTLQPRGTRFYSYSLTTGGPVSAMLASLEQGQRPMSHRLELGIGIPSGTGCAVTSPQNVTPSLVPQIKQDTAVGTYCVRISDVDGLPAAMNFTIRLIHP